MENIIETNFAFRQETTKETKAFKTESFSEFLDYLLYAEIVTMDQVREWMATKEREA